SVNVTDQMRIGYSYDYTITELNNHTSGSHEITLGFDFNFKKSGVSSIRYF
ncbi:MAG: type IX secretion system membrane protein PorP/SprF, partial [Bacteroidia bacterium]|nr:type IX secretion system membrane protein PorP/SprF [Bacteroidia bacterium]